MTHVNHPDHDRDSFDQGFGPQDRTRTTTNGWNERTRGSGYDQGFNRGYDRNASGFDRNYDRTYDRTMGGTDRSYGVPDRGFDRNYNGGYERDRSFAPNNRWNDNNFGGVNDREYDRFNPGHGGFGGNVHPGNYPPGNLTMGGFYPGGYYPVGYPMGGPFSGTPNRGGEQWNQPGPFAGIGPKNFQRSDESIREEVCHRLTQHGHVDAHDVDVSVHNCEVTLKGTVDNRHMKRLTEEVAETVAGVRDVHNQLQVNKTQQTAGTQPTVSPQNQHSDNNVMQTANSNSH